MTTLDSEPHEGNTSGKKASGGGASGGGASGGGLRVCELGVMGYAQALELQRDVNRAVSEGREPDTLLLVEHPPTITITPRRGARDHLLASPYQLKKLGIIVAETDRGGDITYHGPGQLVVYPILRMNPRGLNLGRYMRMLEQVVIDVLAGFGVTGRREDGATGVWVALGAGRWVLGAGVGYPAGSAELNHAAPSAQPPAPSAHLAKICAMGVRVRKNTTMHGLALNVSPDLSHFLSIVPCGLAGRPVTSLRAIFGDRTPAIGAVSDAMVHRMQLAVDEGWA